MSNNTKIVWFDIYCPTCKYSETRELDDPCRECLTFGGREDFSHKPINYVKKKKKRGK